MSSIAFSPAQGSAALEGADHPTKYAGMMPSEMRRVRELEQENARLKKIVADLTLDKEMLQDVIKRKL